MRYGMMILAVVAVLAMGVVGDAATIKLSEAGGGDFTATPFDDTFLSTYQNTSNYGTVVEMKAKGLSPTVEFCGLIAVKNLFTLLPDTGGLLVIDNAILRLTSGPTGGTGSGAEVFRMTTDWLPNAAGSNEGLPTWNEKDAPGDVFWAGGGSFSTSDYTTTNSVVLTWTPAAGTPHDFNVTSIVDNMYTAGNNYGFLFTSTSGHLIYGSTSEAASGQPELIIDYHYSAPIPEPGTMLLLGTGALGVIGYMRRRKIG